MRKWEGIVAILLACSLFIGGYFAGKRTPVSAPPPNLNEPAWECECGPCSAFCEPTEREPTRDEFVVELIYETGYYQDQWGNCIIHNGFLTDLVMAFDLYGDTRVCLDYVKYLEEELSAYQEELNQQNKAAELRRIQEGR